MPHRSILGLTALVVAAGIVIQAVVLIVESIPLIRGDVAPNGSYGFRTAKTMSDAARWYAANTFSGRASVVTGVVLIVSAVALVVQTETGRAGVFRVLVRAFVYDIAPLALLVLILLVYDVRSSDSASSETGADEHVHGNRKSV